MEHLTSIPLKVFKQIVVFKQLNVLNTMHAPTDLLQSKREIGI